MFGWSSTTAQPCAGMATNAPWVVNEICVVPRVTIRNKSCSVGNLFVFDPSRGEQADPSSQVQGETSKPHLQSSSFWFERSQVTIELDNFADVTSVYVAEIWLLVLPTIVERTRTSGNNRQRGMYINCLCIGLIGAQTTVFPRLPWRYLCAKYTYAGKCVRLLYLCTYIYTYIYIYICTIIHA